MRTKKTLRALGFLSVAALLLFTLACINRPMKNARPEPHQVWVKPLPQSVERDVDILFVIDNSVSMHDEQELLKVNFPALMQELRKMVGGLPNVHIGVTTTDIGTGMYPYDACTANGLDGALVKGTCANPQGASFIVDVEPRSCEITKQVTRESVTCSAHTCGPEHCADEPGTTLVTDDNGCPRCVNYSGESLDNVFKCMAVVGDQGCGFEQPLESMKRALENPANTGFVRDNAFLAVILVTDEDDCSASSSELFNNSQNALETTLGYYHSFRCFEFGVVCDVNQRTYQGLRQNCVPREDAQALLHPISRYTDFLRGLKEQEMLVVGAIGGPVNGQSVTTEYRSNKPDVKYSCETDRGAADGEPGGARPGVRLQAFVDAFNEDHDMSWAYTSICSSSYNTALEGIARKIVDKLDQCPPQPFSGCPDPAAEYGEPGDGQSCNDVCEPRCEVTDVRGRDTPAEERVRIPHCLEVCAGGPCAGNADPGQAYAGGHPSARDRSLPVKACWHIAYQPACPQSNYGEIVISRQEDPPARTVADVSCATIAPKEELCNDGRDNDEDCLTDLEDPDCQATQPPVDPPQNPLGQ